MTTRPQYVAAAVVSAWVMAACSAGTTTVRVVHGREVEGHRVPARAYAAYAAGAYLEATGDLAGAERAYRRALRYDSQSAASWIRVGALRCAVDLERGLAALARGLRLDDRYAAGWAERARCLHRHGHSKRALESARRAVNLDPDATDPNLLIATIQARTDPNRAVRWLLALSLRNPGPVEHWRALYDHAAAGSSLRRLAQRELDRRDSPTRTGGPARRGATDRKTRAALSSGDLEAARRAALDERVSPSTLAWLATSMGRVDLAAEQSRLLLASHPDDPELVVLSLVTSGLEGDVRLGPALTHAPRGSRAPSANSARKLEELLRWHVGERAARVWSEAYRRAGGPPE